MLSKLLLVCFWKSSLSHLIFKIRLFWWLWKVSAWAHLWFAAHMFAFVGGLNLPPHINPTPILVYDNLEWDLLCDILFFLMSPSGCCSIFPGKTYWNSPEMNRRHWCYYFEDNIKLAFGTDLLSRPQHSSHSNPFRWQKEGWKSEMSVQV